MSLKCSFDNSKAISDSRRSLFYKTEGFKDTPTVNDLKNEVISIKRIHSKKSNSFLLVGNSTVDARSMSVFGKLLNELNSNLNKVHLSLFQLCEEVEGSIMNCDLKFDHQLVLFNDKIKMHSIRKYGPNSINNTHQVDGKDEYI